MKSLFKVKELHRDTRTFVMELNSNFMKSEYLFMKLKNYYCIKELCSISKSDLKEFFSVTYSTHTPLSLNMENSILELNYFVCKHIIKIIRNIYITIDKFPQKIIRISDNVHKFVHKIESI